MTAPAPFQPRARGVLLPLALFVSAIALVLATGLLAYTHEETQARAEKGRMLATIAGLKVRQISAWLNERRSDAELALHDEQLAEQTEDWLMRGAAEDDATGRSLTAHLQSIMLTSHYQSVMLLDRDLIARVAVGATPAFNDAMRRAARDALQKTVVTFVDNQVDAGQDQRSQSFTLFAPLRAADGVVGLLALNIDPHRYLYPLLDWWPTPDSSGATYLLRHAGKQLIYLSGPRSGVQRFASPTALDTALNNAASRDQTILLEGLDYRRRPVLAGARRIPDTDWLLVTKLDAAEIAQSAQTAARNGMVLTAAFLALFGSLAGVWWQRNRSRYRMAEIERQVLTRHLDYLGKYANDVILLMDENDKVLEANDKALEQYGYTREELLAQPSTRLRAPEARAEHAAQWREADRQQGLVFETVHQHKSGRTFPVEVSARIISVDGKRFRQAIIRDISERKKAEDDIVKARDFYVSLLDIFPSPVWRAGPDAMCNYFNHAWLYFTGRTLEQELGNGWTEGVHADDIDACMDAYLTALRTHGSFIVEFRLRYHDGSYHWVASHGQPFFDINGTFAGYIGSCYDMQQIKNVEERMEFLASHDSLTRLPNRLLLLDRVEHALAGARRDGRQVAVLFIDLDRFKPINDSLGHAVGDQLLRAFAERLCNCVRDADTVSRVGGDEFIVVIPELREAADAAPVAQKILDTMATAFNIENHTVMITPSIGISAFPHDGEDAQTLIKNADAAMYRAKQSGRNAVEFFSPTLRISAHERFNLEYGLRHALAHGEFELHYQPQIDVQTRALVGLEALLRWRHPNKGLLLPAQFLLVAETSNLIVAIGRWVLKAACAQCRAWQSVGTALPVCVNLSPVQFQQHDLVADVATALSGSTLAPQLLSLSVTEDMLNHADPAAQETLLALHALGIGLTIDDFGATHPPLEQFRLHTIDTFMLSRKYVRNIAYSSDDAALSGAIINMAHKHNLKVIAEGVETEDQLKLLSEQGCDAVQGFYFSEALPAGRLDALLKSRAIIPDVASRH